MSEEKITETTRIISEDEVPPDILEKIRRQEENHADKKVKNVVKGLGADLASAVISATDQKIEMEHEAELKRQNEARIRAKSKMFLLHIGKGFK